MLDGQERGMLMNDLKVWRWTGASGVAAGVLLLVVSPLYVIMGTPPSLGDAAKFTDYVTRNNVIGITTKLVDTFYIVGFIILGRSKLRDSGHSGASQVGRLNDNCDVL